MTKEEILGRSGIWPHNTLMLAIDEYAKQQAIDYCSWYNSIGFLPKVKNMEKPGEIFMKDHEELYKEFIEQQTENK